MSEQARADAHVLRYAGFMGHTFCVVVDDSRDGRRTALETCSRESAIRECSTLTDRNPAIYQQVKRGKWRPVPIGA